MASVSLNWLAPRRLVVLALLLLGFALRVPDLSGTPPGISGDEVFYFRDVRAVLRGEGQIYFPTNFGHEPLFIYAEAVSVSLLGANAFALRYTSVFAGMLSLAASYVLGRRLFGPRVGLAAMALLATLFWPVVLTRVGLRASTYPLFTMLGAYALLRALQDRRWRWTIAAGVLNGLTLYTYVASRVFPAVILLWLLTLLVIDRQLLTGNLRRVAVLIVVAALIALPLVVFAAQNPDVVNQRLNTMGGPYFEIQRGDFSGLVANLGRVLGMFTVRGDADAAYNVDAQPVFDPVTSALFYLGLALSLTRFRRPAYALLFIWVFVALTPTLLAIGAPSYLRAGGALFPIVALPGVAVDWLATRAGRAFPTSRRKLSFASLVLGGACLLGGVTAWTMFGVWRSSPGAMKAYGGDLYLAAHYLDETPPPPDATVFVVAQYATDLARSIFNLQTAQDDRVRWTSDFAWPAGSGETWYLFSQDSLPDDSVRALLGVPPARTETDNQGHTVLEIYRLPAGAAPAQPEVQVDVSFDHLLDLLGVTYSQPAVRGQPFEVTLYWKVRPDLSFDPANPPGYRVRLESRGLVWAEDSGLLAFPPLEWQAGDVWIQRARLQIPVDMPPQTIRPELALVTPQRIWPVIPNGDTIARGALLLPEVTISGRPPRSAAPVGLVAQFGDTLALLAADFAAQSAPGLPLFVGTKWQALADVDRDFALQIALDAPDGRRLAVATQVLWEDVYPTRLWQAGEQVRSNDAVQVPVEAGSGQYRVHVRVVDAAGQPLGGGEWIDVGAVEIAGRAHRFDPPPVDVSLDVRFEGVAELVGYRLNLDEARPGGSITLTLVWRALQPSAAPLKVFTHVYDAQDGVAAQHDGVPDQGNAPTTGWLPGEYIQDVHVIALRPDLPPGAYRLAVGLYDEQLPRRLNVQGAEQTDVVTLTAISLP